MSKNHRTEKLTALTLFSLLTYPVHHSSPLSTRYQSLCQRVTKRPPYNTKINTHTKQKKEINVKNKNRKIKKRQSEIPKNETETGKKNVRSGAKQKKTKKSKKKASFVKKKKPGVFSSSNLTKDGELCAREKWKRKVKKCEVARFTFFHALRSTNTNLLQSNEIKKPDEKRSGATHHIVSAYLSCTYRVSLQCTRTQWLSKIVRVE